MTPVERAEHQKQIKAWFPNPKKFHHEIQAAGKKFPFRCLYHLSNSHKSEDCGVLKSGEKSADGSRHTPSSATQGQLRHITEDSIDDSVPDLPDDDVSVEETDNDTNEDALPYFVRMTNHFYH